VDATLAWTVVGSCAGVAGVAVALMAAVTPSRSAGKLNSKIRIKLGAGELDKSGILCVDLASGERSVLTLPKPTEKDSPAAASDEEPPDSLDFTPVNVIFVHNHGQTGVTLTRCQYSAILGHTGFVFEPQPGASERGDHLPKYLAPGEEAIFVHNWATMRVFLNQVMIDHETEVANFEIALMLGDGSKISAPSLMHIHVDMAEDDLAAFLTEHKGTLVRHEHADSPSAPVLLPNGRWWRRAN
jgi:hypothetical protein